MNFITEKDHFCIIIHDKDMTVCASCKTLYDVLHNQVQKISIPYHGQLSRNSQGILQLEIQRDGGILHDWNFQEMWGGGGRGECYIVHLEFPRGQSRVYSLKTLILWP